MCSPAITTYLPGIMAGMNMAGAYGDIKKRQTQAALDTRAAQASAHFDRMALDTQAKQLKQSYGLEMFERERQTARETSRLTTAAGEAGVGGNTPLRELANSMLQSSYDIGIHQGSLENALVMNQAQRQQVDLEEKARLETTRFNTGNPFMDILQIGTAAAQGWYGGQRLQQADDFLPRSPANATPRGSLQPTVDSNVVNTITNRSFNTYNTVNSGSRVSLINPLDFYGSLTKKGGVR